MPTVFLLQHARAYGDDLEHEDVKMIGAYASRAAADAARAELATRPGFCDHPDGFSIDAYELDETHWREGFGDTPDGD